MTSKIMARAEEQEGLTKGARLGQRPLDQRFNFLSMTYGTILLTTYGPAANCASNCF
jgi:hypothetical protein